MFAIQIHFTLSYLFVFKILLFKYCARICRKCICKKQNVPHLAQSFNTRFTKSTAVKKKI